MFKRIWKAVFELTVYYVNFQCQYVLAKKKSLTAWKKLLKGLKIVSYISESVLFGWKRVGKEFQPQLYIKNWIQFGLNELSV